MLETLPDFCKTYWPYLLGGALACAVVSYFSDKFFGYVKKALILSAVLFCLAAGYELVTGDNLFPLPGRIEKKLSEEPRHIEKGHRYYRSYEEEYGEPPPKE